MQNLEREINLNGFLNKKLERLVFGSPESITLATPNLVMAKDQNINKHGYIGT